MTADGRTRHFEFSSHSFIKLSRDISTKFDMVIDSDIHNIGK